MCVSKHMHTHTHTLRLWHFACSDCSCEGRALPSTFTDVGKVESEIPDGDHIHPCHSSPGQRGRVRPFYPL